MSRLTTTIPVLALGVAALALSGCSAGQVTQTSDQAAAVPGATQTVAFKDSDGLVTGSVALRDLMVQYKEGGYAAGGNAPLVVRVFNQGTTPIKLCKAESDKATSVGAGTAAAPAASASAPAPTPSGSASAAPSAAPSAPAAGGSCPLNITVAGSGYALLTPGQAGALELKGLSEKLLAGHQVPMKFTFENDKGQVETTKVFQVPVGPPSTPAPRASSETHGEATQGGGGH
ncbi:hypothetical protein [Longispora albida]|uniref:hypothetical protein n=1 Tax=Longispora albida TaxID=203523 RepID=UPI0003A1E1EC|nr:hypothetical protein [Longispora albida]